MVDTWSRPLKSGDPPANNQDVHTDPDWKTYTDVRSKELFKEEKTKPKYRDIVKNSLFIEVQYNYEMFEVGISGEDPTPWAESGKRVRGNNDSILWTRLYPSITFQRYIELTVEYVAKWTEGYLFPSQKRDVIAYEIFYFPIGEPYTKVNVVAYIFLFASRVNEKTEIDVLVGGQIAPGGSGGIARVGTTVVLKGEDSVVVTLPPTRDDEKAPPLGTKFGNPRKELLDPSEREADVPPLNQRKLSLRVLDAPGGQPLKTAYLELDGIPVGNLAENGEIVLNVIDADRVGFAGRGALPILEIGDLDPEIALGDATTIVAGLEAGRST